MRKYAFLIVLFSFFTGVKLAADASPPCFRALENNFFNRRVVTEALSFVQIQAGLWELIIIDLRGRTPNFHREVLQLAQREKKNPMNYPFQMAKAKDLLEKVLFRNLQATMRANKYTFVREEDIMRVYEFIRARQQQYWILCR